MKQILKILLGIYNAVFFCVLNVMGFVNHMWRERKWTPVAVVSNDRDETL